MEMGPTLGYLEPQGKGSPSNSLTPQALQMKALSLSDWRRAWIQGRHPEVSSAAMQGLAGISLGLQVCN